MSEGRAFARAALAGNPSDMYGGAVLGLTISSLAATAMVRSAAVDDGDGQVVAPNLVDATIGRFAREFPDCGRASELRVTVGTEIPRSVGLGGSSAIVIALLRALCSECGVEIGPDELAELALSIERDDLGIAAGLQDRVTQTYEGVVYMDFAARRYWRLLPDGLPPLLIAWRVLAAAPSGQVHGGLRDRWESGDRVVRGSMRRLAALAAGARDAVTAGDHAALRQCVDGSYDARASMMKLDPRHVEMIEIARGAGAAANYTGSGGAIVCVCSDVVERDTVAEALRDAGCDVLNVQPTG